MDDKKPDIPKKYDHFEVEEKWQAEWDRSGLYRWDPSRPREETFVVDTPPPTVSGSLHVGHAYSYAQTDVIVRFQRMLGKNIFYPMGWDDNGLPTERRAQNVFHIRCDARLPYDPGWVPGRQEGKTPVAVSRLNFIEACEMITREDEVAFEKTWRKLGLSVDWSQVYTTIGNHCRKISQMSFLDLVAKGLAENSESITMWDVDFRTAVSQAEVEDREVTGAFHDLKFTLEDGEDFIISTTRPELLAACIAVAAHPDDGRYQKYIGRTALTPLFAIPVPVVASEHADPEKGSGILMICTFGDMADVEWWRRSGLPSKQIIGRDGRLLNIVFGDAPFISRDPERAQKAYDRLAGLRIAEAKRTVVDMLREPGSAPDGRGVALEGDARMITHPVRFYEKGDHPLEFIPTRQWFVKILEFKSELLAQGEKIRWHPAYMKARYDHWVMGLNQEWCISRQRYFGVPLPVWYPVLDNGEPDFGSPLFPEQDDLPVDPLTDVPRGYQADQRDKPGGFTGENDVMDTWGTSSMTPQISSHWKIDDHRHRRLFPADLRPQAHDIIRTWAFYTITKAWMHEREIPWKHAAISGFILDPDRKKMSKSKGNVMTPETLLNENSSDVFRYWASRGRLGVDSAFDETLFKIGRKLVIKIFNASKFVMMQFSGDGRHTGPFGMDGVMGACDRSWVHIMRRTIEEATRAFTDYDYTAALQVIEDTFWNFCDNYLEMVKAKAYEGGRSPESGSALSTLDWSLYTFLRLFAPFMPFVCEEIWSWRYGGPGQSVHTAPWPAAEEVAAVAPPDEENGFTAATEVISKIRGFKTTSQVSLKTPVTALEIRGSAEDLEILKPFVTTILESTHTLADPVIQPGPVTDEDGQRFHLRIVLGEHPEKQGG